MYEFLPIPEGRYTRVLRVRDSTPDARLKLCIQLSLLDLDQVAPPSGENLTQLELVDDEAEFPIGYDALSYTWGCPVNTPSLQDEYGATNDVSVSVEAGREQDETKIGRNLYEALLALWEAGRHTCLWVDALCINQEDLVEKAGQVLLMADIYSSAREVLVWMGRDDPDEPMFDDIFLLHTDFMDEVDQYEAEHGRIPVSAYGIIHPEGDAELLINNEQGLELGIPADVLRSLYKFYAQRRYLSRAWILQEIVLAQDAIVLLDKGRWIRFEQLADLAGHLYESPLTRVFIQKERGLNEGNGKELAWILDRAQQTFGRAEEGHFEKFWPELDALYGSRDEHTRHHALMEVHLTSGHQLRASVPSDAIHSLLGFTQALVGADAPLIQPDYAASTEDVYTTFTSQALRVMPHRTILSLVNGRLEASSVLVDIIPDAPSWVPDFSSCKIASEAILAVCTQLWRRFDQLPEFAAGLDDPSTTPIAIDGKRLTLFARRCSGLARHIRPFQASLDYANYRDGVASAASWLVSVFEMCSQPTKRGAQIPSVEAIFRVLCYSTSQVQDMESFIRQVENLITTIFSESRAIFLNDVELMATLDTLQETLASLSAQQGIPTTDTLSRILSCAKTVAEFEKEAAEGSVDSDASQELIEPAEEVKEALSSWNAVRFDKVDPRFYPSTSIFFTEHDYVGRTDNELEDGDELWLICQAKVPFVLRPSSEGKFQLVGEAFVHGAMYGELIENGVAGEPQWITIV